MPRGASTGAEQSCAAVTAAPARFVPVGSQRLRRSSWAKRRRKNGRSQKWARGGSPSATGKPYENEYCFVFDVRGGKIQAIREYVDLEKAKIALAP